MNGQVPEPFEVLSAVHDSGGTISPVWRAETDRGYIYSVDGTDINDRALESLAQSDHLERIFADRISRCPSCRDHSLNFREVCITCKSANIRAVELLHHFRCGYVAPTYQFTPEADGRRCPKCHGMLRDRGTDHDVPGPQFLCEACDLSFQLPEIGAVCLNCGRSVHGNDLERIIYEDVYAYKLSSHGAAALRSGSLDPARGGELTESALPLLRRSVFAQFLDDERRRARRFRSTFSVLLLTVHPPADKSASSDESALLGAVAEVMSETDKLGRYDEAHYLALLPSVDSAAAEALARQLSSGSVPVLREWQLGAQRVTLPEDSSVTEPLSSALAALVDD